MSNNNQEAVNYIRGLPFYQDVDGEVISYDYHIMKPDKEIYEILLNKYNLIPDECVFVDDKAKNVEAANELGIHGIKFEPKNFKALVNQLSELS